MKTLIYTALFCFAIMPVNGQQAGGNRKLDDAAGDEAAAAGAQEYADRVETLLRDIHSSLQGISEQREAGQLTAAQARALKLEATRLMIARLETASAVYEARAASGQVVAARELSKETNESANVRNLNQRSAQ